MVLEGVTRIDENEEVLWDWLGVCLEIVFLKVFMNLVLKIVLGKGWESLDFLYELALKMFILLRVFGV